MKLVLVQRFFSWFDSFDIYDENGDILYRVEGKLSWGHEFHIFDKSNNSLGKIKEQIFHFLPHFDLYIGDNRIGEIIAEFSFFKPKLKIEVNNWYIEGDYFGWDYRIFSDGQVLATISKQIFNLTDTYQIEVDSSNALLALMVALSIDAINCSKNN